MTVQALENDNAALLSRCTEAERVQRSAEAKNKLVEQDLTSKLSDAMVRSLKSAGGSCSLWLSG